jgi:hypothetical protein
MIRYVINGWLQRNGEFFCDYCGYSEKSGKHAPYCPRRTTEAKQQQRVDAAKQQRAEPPGAAEE